jgi:hypothetical protein
MTSFRFEKYTYERSREARNQSLIDEGEERTGRREAKDDLEGRRKMI